MEPTKYYSQSAAVRGCGILKQMIVYAYRNRCTKIARRKGGLRCLGLSGWINLTSGEINLICARILSWVRILGFELC